MVIRGDKARVIRPRLLLAITTIVLSAATPALAQCGDSPAVVDETLKGEIENRAKDLSGLMGSAQEKSRVEMMRVDIFRKYSDDIRARSEAYLQYVFCTTYLRDARLSPEDRLRAIQAMRQPAGPSEAQKELLDHYEQAKRESGLKDIQLAIFFGEIGESKIPPESLYQHLHEVAETVKSLRGRLEAIQGRDPILGKVKLQADAALESGAYDRAEALVGVASDQVHAVDLILAGHPDQALDVLQEAERRLAKASANSSAMAVLQHGYLYKTSAEAFQATGDRAHADRYLDLALESFELVTNDPDLTGKTTIEFAGAMNGIGSVRHSRGKYREAIADYQAATTLLPTYTYAWHDMFVAYVDLARTGEVDLPAMRSALDHVKETAGGVLDANYMATLEAALRRFEPPADAVRGTPR
jgi:tetratricopeptide (TPR) repeat protein